VALGDLWNRTLVYFGIAEEDEWDDDYAATEELERSYEERRANVRRNLVVLARAHGELPQA